MSERFNRSLAALAKVLLDLSKPKHEIPRRSSDVVLQKYVKMGEKKPVYPSLAWPPKPKKSPNLGEKKKKKKKLPEEEEAARAILATGTPTYVIEAGLIRGVKKEE